MNKHNLLMLSLLFIVGGLFTPSAMALRTPESDIVLSSPPELVRLMLQGKIGRHQQLMPSAQRLTVQYQYAHPSGIPESSSKIEYFLIDGPQKTLLSTGSTLDLDAVDIGQMAGKTVEACVTLEAQAGYPNKSTPYCTSHYVSKPVLVPWANQTGASGVTYELQAGRFNSQPSDLRQDQLLRIRVDDEFGDRIGGKVAIMVSLVEQRDRQGNVRTDSGALQVKAGKEAPFEMKLGDSRQFITDDGSFLSLNVQDPDGIGVESTLTATAFNSSESAVVRGRVRTSPDSAVANMWGNMDEVVNGISRPRLYAEVVRKNTLAGRDWDDEFTTEDNDRNVLLKSKISPQSLCQQKATQSISGMDIAVVYNPTLPGILENAKFHVRNRCSQKYAIEEPLRYLDIDNERYAAAHKYLGILNPSTEECSIYDPISSPRPPVSDNPLILGGTLHLSNNYSKFLGRTDLHQYHGWPNGRYASILQTVAKITIGKYNFSNVATRYSGRYFSTQSGRMEWATENDNTLNLIPIAFGKGRCFNY